MPEVVVIVDFSHRLHVREVSGVFVEHALEHGWDRVRGARLIVYWPVAL